MQRIFAWLADVQIRLQGLSWEKVIAGLAAAGSAYALWRKIRPSKDEKRKADIEHEAAALAIRKAHAEAARLEADMLRETVDRLRRAEEARRAGEPDKAEERDRVN